MRPRSLAKGDRGARRPPGLRPCKSAALPECCWRWSRAGCSWRGGCCAHLWGTRFSRTARERCAARQGSVRRLPVCPMASMGPCSGTGESVVFSAAVRRASDPTSDVSNEGSQRAAGCAPDGSLEGLPPIGDIMCAPPLWLPGDHPERRHGAVRRDRRGSTGILISPSSTTSACSSWAVRATRLASDAKCGLRCRAVLKVTAIFATPITALRGHAPAGYWPRVMGHTGSIGMPDPLDQMLVPAT